MKSIYFLCILFAMISVSQLSSAQDSLVYSQTFMLSKLHSNTCTKWGEDWNSKQFEAENATYFDSIADFIQSNPQAKFEIRCYSDSRGSDSANFSMTQNCADIWVKSLLKRGVNREDIEGIGVGELFPRTVWIKDSTYFVEDPNDPSALKLNLTEEYINSFRNDKKRFDYLHLLNQRTELSVSELDENEQRRVNHKLHLREFYGDKQVVLIGAGTIQSNDTLRIKNEGNLHLHLVAAGTENEFKIRSLENKDEAYSYNRFKLGKEELLDLSSAKGAYHLDFFGDGGSGELILNIE